MNSMEFPKTDSILVLAVDKFLEDKLPALDGDTRRAISLLAGLQVSLVETVCERTKKGRGADFHLHAMMRKLLSELATPGTVSASDQTLIAASLFYSLGALGAGRVKSSA